MSQIELVTLNVGLYSSVFLFSLRNYGFKNVGVLMLLFYTLSSCFSLFFFRHPFFINSLNYVPNGIEIEGVFYLFTINMLLVLPFLRVDIRRFYLLRNLDFNLFYRILLICSILYVLQFLINIPQMIKIGSMNTGMLSDLRNETYESGSFESQSSILSALSRVLGGVRFLYLFLSIIGFFIDKKRKKFYTFCLIIYIVGFVQTSLLWVARAPLVLELLVFFVLFVFFHDLIPSKVRKKILFYSGLLVTAGLFFTVAITYSRFGDNTSDSFNLVTYSVVRYLGEPQINFLGLMYDNTNDNLYGYKSFMLFRRFLGLPYAGGYDKTMYYDYLSNIMNCPSYFLYQLGGILYADWGKVGALIFASIFSAFIYYLTRRTREMPIYNLQTILLMSTLVSKGMFYSEFSSEKGNLMFVFAFLFYLLCKFKARGKTSLFNKRNVKTKSSILLSP